MKHNLILTSNWYSNVVHSNHEASILVNSYLQEVFRFHCVAHYNIHDHYPTLIIYSLKEVYAAYLVFL
jgi:hypothetical protein